MFVKICGLKNKEQINWAIDAGYDAIGIVTHHKSTRFCNNDLAIELANYAKGRIKTFVVGKTYNEIVSVKDHFDIIQLYKYHPLKNLAFSSYEIPCKNLEYEYFIYDASIGSGVFTEIPRWINDVSGNVIIAGGINSSNVINIINNYHPYGIDISSGVEIKGEKNHRKMDEFINTIRHKI